MRYVEGTMYEDTDYILHAFLLAEKVQRISINAYYYRINNASVTLSPISPIKLAWRVNQLVRCARLIKIAKSPISKKQFMKWLQILYHNCEKKLRTSQTRRENISIILK